MNQLSDDHMLTAEKHTGMNFVVMIEHRISSMELSSTLIHKSTSCEMCTDICHFSANNKYLVLITFQLCWEHIVNYSLRSYFLLTQFRCMLATCHAITWAHAICVVSSIFDFINVFFNIHYSDDRRHQLAVFLKKQERIYRWHFNVGSSTTKPATTTCVDVLYVFYSTFNLH